jgi:hypothetical protein
VRGVKSTGFLTPKRRVPKVVEIIGPTAQGADIENVIDFMEEQVTFHDINRLRKSKDPKQFAKKLSAALRNTMTLLRKAPTDLRVPPHFVVSASEIDIADEVFDHEHLLRHLMLLNEIAERWEKSKLGKPKPRAEAKRLAAWAALHLCEIHNIKPTTTKTDKLCKIAAALYGEPRADLQHHCRWVLKERKAGSKAFIPLRSRVLHGVRLRPPFILTSRTR